MDDQLLTKLFQKLVHCVYSTRGWIYISDKYLRIPERPEYNYLNFFCEGRCSAPAWFQDRIAQIHVCVYQLHMCTCGV